MLYKTHKAGGAVGALALFSYMQVNSMLIEDISPIIQLCMIYGVSSWASTSADLDHIQDNIKEQTPINLLINKILHIGKCSHRSWQTHCILITGGICALLLSVLYCLKVCFPLLLTRNDISILTTIIFGLVAGWGSHLILDMMTTAGVHIIPGIKIRLVPKSEKFKTGGTWEKIVRVILYIFIILLFLLIILQFFGISPFKTLIDGG